MVKAAIIGCGRIAGGYDNRAGDKVRTHAKAYISHPGSRLVGVSDINEDVARHFSEAWGVDQYFTDYSIMLKTCKPDIVSICAPTQFHDEIFKAVCDFGPRYIWLEKPASLTVDGLRKMISLSRSVGTSVWVNYFRRYDSGFKRVKALLQSLGQPVSVNASYTKGLKHNGCHMLDTLMYLFGEVRSFKVYDVIEDDDYPSVSAHLYFDQFKVDLISLDYQNFELFEIDMIFQTGRIRILDGGQVIEFYNVTTDKYYEGYKNLHRIDTHSDSYGVFMLQGLTQGLDGDPMPTLEQELSLVQLTERILKTRVNHDKAYI